MELKDYMEKTFPKVALMPGLYEQWDTGIAFELGKNLYQFKSNTDELNPEYFQIVFHQAKTIFNALFAPEDEIFLVTNLYQYKDFKRIGNKKMKVYHRYVKSKAVRNSLKQATLPFILEDDEDSLDKCTTQFSLKCRKRDIHSGLLIKAISHQDFPSLKPRLHNPYDLYEPDVFFVNTTRNIIFYMYDDRGCEVIARDAEMLQPLYKKYHNWLDEAYKEEIEQRLK